MPEAFSKQNLPVFFSSIFQTFSQVRRNREKIPPELSAANNRRHPAPPAEPIPADGEKHVVTIPLRQDLLASFADREIIEFELTGK